MALFGGAVVCCSRALPQPPNPETLLLAIALIPLTGWLIDRLRTSR